MCKDGKQPISCLYQYNPISEHFDHMLPTSRNYSVQMAATYKKNRLQVEWSQESILTADSKIKRFQVVLESDGEYMSRSFPVPKDQFEFVLDDVFTSVAGQFNVCVEVVGISNEIIAFSCKQFNHGTRDLGATVVAPIVVVSVLLVSTAAVVFVVWFLRFRTRAAAGRGLVGGAGGGSVVYEHFAEDDASADPAVGTSHVTISGLPSEFDEKPV